MSIAEVHAVPVEALGDPTRLDPLARAIFGEGQRPHGWFARKLQRECVVPAGSVLLTQSRDAAEADAWVGYALLGRPPSLGAHARTAGIGVVPRWRGRGLGRRLVEAVGAAARDLGAQGLLVPASSAAAPFYARCGLDRHLTTHTLWATGTGETPPDPTSPEGWDSACPGPQRSGWFREAWERTPEGQRRTVRVLDDADRFDVSMEGSAHVALRWTSREGGVQGPRAWLRATPAGSPALLHEIAADAPQLPDLRANGWSVAQTTITMLATWPPTGG